MGQETFYRVTDISVISGNEKNVTSFLASVIDSLDGFVGGSNCLDCSIIDTSVTNLD